MATRGSDGLRSVSAALELLNCVGSDAELGPSEIARRLDIAKSTAHRLLSTLCAKGFVDQDPDTGRYRLGLHVYELGHQAGNRLRLRQAAFPMLRALRERTGCSVHLAVPYGHEVFYLERLETDEGLRWFQATPWRQPVHCTSTGKAIAAFDPASARARYRAGFPVLTKLSIRSAAHFERELRTVTSNGYAVNCEEAALGWYSVAAPVLDRSGRARAAVSIVAPARQGYERILRHAPLTGSTADRLAAELGI